MRNKIFFISVFILSTMLGLKSHASPIVLSDSAQISVLTCAPWPKEVYAIYGHSAMRVYDPATKVDEDNVLNVVFNYGVFDFRSPNFTYRFMAGETDYIVVPINYDYYLFEYEKRGVDVYEQTINLTKEEKQKVWKFLYENAKEENRVYRYNIFYNNCTTKLRDILESNINGTIEYPNEKQITSDTFRSLVHEHVNQQPWAKFGIDLVIGSNADKPITVREKLFLPIYEMDIFDHSVIKTGDGSVRPLVSKNKIVVSSRQEEGNDEIDNSFFSSPLFVTLILLFITILVTVYGFKKEKCLLCNIFDFLLFFLAGIVGFIIFFMIFFSVHPCTEANWNIVWLNPLLLLASFLFFVKSVSKYIFYYHFINFAVLAIFILAWYLIPQQLEIAFLPIILSILIRCGVFVLKNKKVRKKNIK